MSQIVKEPFFAKIFELIIRIRDYENKPLGSFVPNLKYMYFVYRDRIRTISSLYAAKLVFLKEKETIEFLLSCYRHRHLSHGQLFQDVLAYFVSPKMNGFFVEFGATDGCFLSNTLFLEKQHGWKGVLAEPARSWAKKLEVNRAGCAIDFRCVWRKSGEQIDFVEDTLPEISGVSETLNKNRMSTNPSSYTVNTVSLMDLLEEHHAPRYIDFISIDTEGSEFGILEHFDFSNYQFGLIAVEHNYQTEKREKILSLLTRNHYRRILQNLSAEDDWYVPSSSNKFQD